MYNPVMYIFINKSLHMSSGKVGAQAAHAAIMSMINAEGLSRTWETSPQRTVILLEARNEAHMRSIREYLNQRDIYSSLVIDEGVNEIDEHTPTALATIILDKDNELVVKSMSSFKLYKDSVKVTVEVDK